MGCGVSQGTSWSDRRRNVDRGGDWLNADAKFVAHAREDVPKLLAWVRLLQSFLADTAQDDGFKMGVLEGRRQKEEETQKQMKEAWEDINKELRKKYHI